MNNQPISVSKAKKAIADYKKAIGHPEGMAELSIFYCEEAFGFLESCSMEDESYFAALIRMYGRSLESRKNSIAFGTLPLWIRVNEGSFWAAAKPECPLFSAVIGRKPDVVRTSPRRRR